MTDQANQPDDDPQLDAQYAGVARRLRHLRIAALIELAPPQQERARKLIAEGDNLKLRSVGDGLFELRQCPPDGSLDGSVLLMTLPRSAVLGNASDN